MSASRPLRRCGAVVASLGLLAVAVPPVQAQEPAPDPELVRQLDQLTPAQQDQAAAAGMDAEQLQREAAMDQLAASADQGFYAAPSSLPVTDGDVVRTEPMDFYLDPVQLIRPAADSTRVMYRTTDHRGQGVAATATVLDSQRPWSGAGERPLVVLSPGTQGMGDQCAPSRQLAMGTEYEGLAVTSLIERGYDVVVPDYIGLGTDGAHTYMNRVDQGHAVLDAARAAQRLGAPGLDAGTRVALVGYSQGGGATASAAELAPEHAPDLDLIAAWVGAPPADLTLTGRQIDGGLYAGLSYYVMGSAAQDGIDIDALLDDQGMADYGQAQQECVTDTVLNHAFTDSSTRTESGRSLSELLGTPELAGWLQEQKLGVQGRRPEVPVRIAHGLTDDVVPYRAGRQLAQRWCASGADVSFQTLVTPTHVGGYAEGLPGMNLYLDARTAGLPQVSSCWRL